MFFLIENVSENCDQLVGVCVTPLHISPTGQSPTVGSDATPNNRVGVCVPAFSV